MTGPIIADIAAAIVQGEAQEELNIPAAQQAIRATFGSADLNPGQRAIADGYVEPAMEDACEDVEAEGAFDELLGAGLEAHYAAEESLSATITRAAQAAASALQSGGSGDLINGIPSGIVNNANLAANWIANNVPSDGGPEGWPTGFPGDTWADRGAPF